MPDKHNDNESSPSAEELLRVQPAKLVRTATISGTGAVVSAGPTYPEVVYPKPLLEHGEQLSLHRDNHREVSTPTDTGSVPTNANDNTFRNAVSSAQVIVVDSTPFASAAPLTPILRSDVSSSRPPPSKANRVNGAYCLVRDESGKLAPSSSASNRPPPSHAPELHSRPTGEGRRWSLVPSPVIALEAQINRTSGHLSPADARESSSGADESSVRGDNPLAISPVREAETNEFQNRSSGGGRPAFDPSSAYPNAPAAQPFVARVRAARTASPVRALRANAWLFRFGVMGLPALGVGGCWAIIHVWLPPWMWPAVVMCVLAGAVSALILLHRAWASIADAETRISPRRAVLLLFVPIFNVYWIFKALPGFATDYNRFVERHQLRARPLSRNVLLAVMVPLLGLVFCWSAIGAICEAINSTRGMPHFKRSGPKSRV